MKYNVSVTSYAVSLDNGGLPLSTLAEDTDQKTAQGLQSWLDERAEQLVRLQALVRQAGIHRGKVEQIVGMDENVIYTDPAITLVVADGLATLRITAFEMHIGARTWTVKITPA